MDKMERIEELIRKNRVIYIKEQMEKMPKMVQKLFDYSLTEDSAALEDLKRFFHSLKGSGATLQMDSLTEIGRQYEDSLEELVRLRAEKSYLAYVILKGLAQVQQEIMQFDAEQKSKEMYEDMQEYAERSFLGHILILDDDKSLLDLIDRVLRKEGYNVHIATKYEDALPLLKNNRIDLFFLDLNMPDYSGFEVLEKIHREQIAIPVVLLTGDDREETRVRAETEGVFAMIAKPFKAVDFIDQVDGLLKRIHQFEDTSMEPQKHRNTEAEELVTPMAGIRQKRILVVDDESVINRLIKARLDGFGFDVSYVSDGQEGIKKSLEEPPDLMIVDLNLPKTDGFEVIRQVKSNPATNQIKILILSSKSKEEDKLRCFQLGADDYLTKPFALAELEHRIHKLLH